MAKPKKYITIYRWRVPVVTLGRAIFILLLIVAVLLPWTQARAILGETPLKQSAAMGSIDYYIYPLGFLVNITNIVTYDFAGNPTEHFHYDVSFSPTIMAFGLLVVILIVLNLLLLLYESDFRASFVKALQSKISVQLYFVLETIIAILAMALVFVYSYAINILSVDGLSIYQIKIDFLESVYHFKSTYYHTKDPVFIYQWGAGFILFFLVASALFVYWLDKYYFVEKLDLSISWRLRGHMIILSIIYMLLPNTEAIIGSTYHVWSLVFHEVITEESIVIEANPAIMIWALILLIAEGAIFILGAKYLPSRYLMKATPFITLALPDDELTRRHKMLPTVTRWYRLIDWGISLIAFVILGLFYVIFVRGFGTLALDILKEGGAVVYRKGAQWSLVWSYTIYEGGINGVLWTVTPAHLLVLFVVIQALMILRPTR